MNILIAGYGGVGQAVQSMLEKYPIAKIQHIEVAEILNGHSAEAMIDEKKDFFNVVINLTTESNMEIYERCQKYGIHYIDTGFLDPRDVISILKHPRSEGTINLFGFGMNPGLIEFMYRRYKMNGQHSAILVEWDTAQGESDLFCTWSPHNYLEEAAVDVPFFCEKGLIKDVDLADIVCAPGVLFDGLDREYLWVPHEEVYSITHANPDCAFCGFLYSAPTNIHNLAKELRNTGAPFPKMIPLVKKLTGNDTIGILFVEANGRTNYVYNSANHEQRFQDYGVNGTCWQVACGVHTAIAMIDDLKPGSYTMSTIPEQMNDFIEKHLKQIGFQIESQEIVLSTEQKNYQFTSTEGRVYYPFVPQ